MVNLFQTNSLILLAFLVIALATLSGCTKPPYTNLDNEQLKAKLDQNIPLYDVRRPEEWLQTGVVKNSRLLTFADQSGRLKPDFIRKFTAAIGKHEAVMLICRTGNRTDSLARFLIEKLGYTQVYNVRRGIRGWIREGPPSCASII